MDHPEIREKTVKLNSNFSLLENTTDASFQKIFGKINLIGLACFGIFGSLFCMYVFLHKNMRKRKFHWYLLVVAVFEFLFSLTLSIDYMYKMFDKDSRFLHDINVYITMLIDYLTHFIDSYVTMLTLILSIDRLYAINHLPDQRHFITYKHAKFLIFITFISILVLKIPVLILCYENTDRYFNIISCTILSPLFFNLLPSIAILIVNSILIFRLIKFYTNLSRERRSLISKRSISRRQSELNLKICKRKSKTNIIINEYPLTAQPLCKTQKVQFVVIIVTALWLVLVTLLYYPLSMFYSYVHFFKFDVSTLSKLQIISSTLFNLRHCTHFFIYFAFNFEFRKYLLKLFKKSTICA